MADFENVKIGDKVIIKHHYAGNSIATVKKVNKITFVADCGNYDMTFMKSSGREKGETWTPAYAYPATEEMIEKVRKENKKANYIHAIHGCRFEDLSYDVLEQIYNLIK